MVINNVKTVGADNVDSIYIGLNKSKYKFAKLLEKEGYRFIANNYQNMDAAKKWDAYDLIKVANSHKRTPRYLWAIKLVE